MHLTHIVLAGLVGITPLAIAADADLAATAINRLGLDLHRRVASADDNTCLSPYSIQAALAMTYAGADGETRSEMTRVLHFGDDEAALHRSFAALQEALASAQEKSAELARQTRQHGGTSDELALHTANRLFGERNYEFRAPFLELLRENYTAPLEPVDFTRNASGATRRINAWVEEQTRDRIRDLVPDGALTGDTRLVLVNAVYLKAPWVEPFNENLTSPEPFHVRGRDAVPVPTMRQQERLGYRRFTQFTAVSLPYHGRDLQFLVLVPDAPDGIARLESTLTPDVLAECARLPSRDVILHLPKFRLEPPTLPLGEELRALGLRTAFDQPPGSANFDRMASKRPNDHLAISEVFHKTFIALDEKGTEAAAATAVAMIALSAPGPRPQPVEVKVDRPFVFAIQHVPSGACLFLGRVIDPR